VRRDDAQPVYSTEGGDLRRAAGRRPRAAAPAATPGPPNDGVVRVGRTKSGKGGKTVTQVTGLPGGDAELRAAAKELKRVCGSGGTVRDGLVEVQGDHRERIAAHLTARGHRVKLTGG
jgi:translation initiation factor 1